MTLDERLRPSRREAFGAWLLTGPPGRGLSFAIDFAAALRLVARHLAGRLTSRRGRNSP